jgi:hypothetical protein
MLPQHLERSPISPREPKMPRQPSRASSAAQAPEQRDLLEPTDIWEELTWVEASKESS